MPARALIIGIEEYPAVQGGLATSLPGTIDAALQFRRWLIDQRGVAEPNIRFCAHPHREEATAGATRTDIVGEIRKLYEEGRETTDALFIYFSGHGFAFSDVDDRRMDVLVCSDFANASDSGGCCLKLDELQQRLRIWLGPGEHFYFVDACRNLLSRQDIDVLGLGITKPRSALGEPALHSLQSTIEGAVAAVGSEFPKHLLEGLQGSGRAKSWEHAPQGAMVVHFRSLTEYLLAKMPGQPVDPAPDGRSPGVLQIIEPAPIAECTIIVEGLADDQTAALNIVNRQNQLIFADEVGNGHIVVGLAPEDYFVSVGVGAGTVSPAGWVKLDMYEPVPLSFEVEVAGATTRSRSADQWITADPRRADLMTLARRAFRAETVDGAIAKTRAVIGPGPDRLLETAAQTAFDKIQHGEELTTPEQRALELVIRVQRGLPWQEPKGALHATLPPGTELRLREAASTLAPIVTAGDTTIDLSAGRYEAELHDHDGAVIHRSQINIIEGSEQKLDLASFEPGGARKHLLQAVESGREDGLADFSEQLGPSADQDLGLWLAIVGASRIFGGAGAFRKLGPLPLAEFKNVPRSGRPVYLLVGLDDAAAKLQFGVSRGRRVAWKVPRPVPQIPGLQELVLDAPSGPFVISWSIGKQAPISIASVALPHRATLVTLSQGEDGKLQASQFLLPIPHLMRYLHPHVRQRIQERTHLRDVKFLYRTWRAFRERRDVFAVGPSEGMAEILYDKWIDPVGALLASYEFIRRGRRSELDMVMRNLNRYFPELPDTAAITRLVTGAARPPKGAPLFLEGAMAFEDHPKIFPLRSSLLDYRMTWTAWRDAVQPAR